MEKQTAVEWLQQQIGSKIADANIRISAPKFYELINQAKQIEIQQAHEYAEFAIRCDRKEMKILNFDGFIKLKSE